VPAHVERGSDGSRWFAVLDPESNKVEFVEPPKHVKPVDAPNVIGHHIIHVGFLVHDRAVEDKFYRDLLGFRPYWWGGRGNNPVEWVSQQVPDGHDWLEYMLAAGPGSGVPAGMTQQTLGVLDHFSVARFPYRMPTRCSRQATGSPEKHDQGPKIGLDGKYQFNMYDPDGIRI
jgi:catechol 2,3-dioxygenase-like lactoylglutathione lyase family enzyme